MKKVKYNYGDLKSHDAMGVVIKNAKGEILMQDHVKFGFWTIPIGKAEEDQSVEEGLKQEMLEECGIKVESCKERISKEYSYERDGKKVKVKSHIFEVEKYSGILKNNEPQKHRSQIFINLEKIKKLPYLSDATVLYLESLGFKREAKI